MGCAKKVLLKLIVETSDHSPKKKKKKLTLNGPCFSFLGLPQKVPQTRWLKARNVLPGSLGGWKPKMQESAGLALWKSVKECLSQLLGACWPPLAFHLCLRLHMVFSLGICLYPNFPFYRTTVILSEGPTLFQHDLLLTITPAMILSPNKVSV